MNIPPAQVMYLLAMARSRKILRGIYGDESGCKVKRIHIDINCTDTTCHECQFLTHGYHMDDHEYMFCLLYDRRLTGEDGSAPRLHECLAAEVKE